MKTGKKLRWYMVSYREAPEEGGYVISAYSHSRAKIQWGNYIEGCYSNFEALKGVRATLIKAVLPVVPEKEGEMYPDERFEEDLIWKGVFTHRL